MSKSRYPELEPSLWGLFFAGALCLGWLAGMVYALWRIAQALGARDAWLAGEWVAYVAIWVLVGNLINAVAKAVLDR